MDQTKATYSETRHETCVCCFKLRSVVPQFRSLFHMRLVVPQKSSARFTVSYLKICSKLELVLNCSAAKTISYKLQTTQTAKPEHIYRRTIWTSISENLYSKLLRVPDPSQQPRTSCLIILLRTLTLASPDNLSSKFPISRIWYIFSHRFG